jgi:hypothetical protein
LRAIRKPQVGCVGWNHAHSRTLAPSAKSYPTEQEVFSSFPEAQGKTPKSSSMITWRVPNNRERAAGRGGPGNDPLPLNPSLSIERVNFRPIRKRKYRAGFAGFSCGRARGCRLYAVCSSNSLFSACSFFSPGRLNPLSTLFRISRRLVALLASLS